MKRYYVNALSALLLASSLYAESPNLYLGSVWATGAGYCPADSLPADGRLLAISSHNELFSVIKNIYGGNGTTDFALPDLRERTPVGVGTGRNNTNDQNLSEVMLGVPRGSKSVLIAPEQLPKHSHGAPLTVVRSDPITVNVAVSSQTGTVNAPTENKNQLSGSTPGSGGARMWSSVLTNPIPLADVKISAGTGSGSVIVDSSALQGVPFSVIPPSLGVTYCVSVTGIYPGPQP